MYLQFNQDQEKYILEKTNVSDIWGVFSGLSNFLINHKVNNAFQLTKFNEDFAKKKGIVLLKTILELKGTLCNQIEEVSRKKSICVSRSFGK